MSIGPKSGKKDNSKRRFSGKGGRRNNPFNIEAKRSEAVERQETWTKLGPKGQLAALDSRLGKGVGAAKQRRRLQALIENPPRVAKKDAPVPAAEHVKAKDRRAQQQAERPNK